MHLDLVMAESTVLGAQHPALKLDTYAKPFWEPSVSAGCQAVSMGGDSETGGKSYLDIERRRWFTQAN